MAAVGFNFTVRQASPESVGVTIKGSEHHDGEEKTYATVGAAAEAVKSAVDQEVAALGVAMEAPVAEVETPETEAIDDEE